MDGEGPNRCRGQGRQRQTRCLHEDVKAHPSSMLGKVLITHQTGTAGKVVRKVLIEQCTEIDQEFYVGIALDRATSGITLMAWSTIWEQEAVACNDLTGHTEIYWC